MESAESMPDALERRAVERHFVGEPLGVEPPSLAVAHDLELADDRVEVELVGQGDLEVVAGNGLMKRDRLELVAAPRGGFAVLKKNVPPRAPSGDGPV